MSTWRPTPASALTPSTNKQPLRGQKSSPSLRSTTTFSTGTSNSSTSASTALPKSRLPTKSATSSTTSTTNPSSTLRSKASLTKLSVPPTPIRPRSTSPTKAPRTPSRLRTKPPPLPEVPETPRAVNIREQIALKRAEAKKAKTGDGGISISWVGEDPLRDLGSGSGGGEGDEGREEDDLGRLSVKVLVERARTTGNLNISSRSLPALPTSLFTVHLGVDPAPLASQSQTQLKDVEKNRPESAIPWYEAVDLTVLKARDNEIVELHPEIALFGSLKIIDLHSNHLASLPPQFSELISLTHLDLSSNSFTSFPSPVIQLPSLTSLNLTKNDLESLPFGSSSSQQPTSPPHPNSFFAPSRARDTNPLPSLQVLLVSENELTSATVDFSGVPETIIKLDLSHNPLGTSSSTSFLIALSRLTKLRELNLRGCQLSDVSLPSPPKPGAFPRLETLDLGDNEAVSDSHVQSFLGERRATIGEDHVDGGVKVISGRKIMKEAWELEAEKRGRGRSATPASDGRSATKSPILQKPPTPVIKEQWELDAEMGLTTAAGRLRAKMAVSHSEPGSSRRSGEAKSNDVFDAPQSPVKSTPSTPPSLNKYYTASHASLSLPPSLPPSRKPIHARSVSLSYSANGPSSASDPSVPRETMPLSLILAQSWGNTLRVLDLNNRRADICFLLGGEGLNGGLPRLEELKMEGCELRNEIRVIERPWDASSSSKEETKSPLLETLMRLFPSLTVLDLSYNQITTLNGIEEMFFPSSSSSSSSSSGGLKALRVRGNKISDLGPLVSLGERFERAGSARVGVEGWRGEEIDIRENEVGKLPPILGLLPLDIFLVEGNLFRVPGRRVWERDGTKGLLKWLKDSL